MQSKKAFPCRRSLGSPAATATTSTKIELFECIHSRLLILLDQINVCRAHKRYKKYMSTCQGGS